jgi:hypothetical protein
VNADDFYGRESYEVLARFLDRTADDPSLYAMVGFPLRNTMSDYGAVARGICALRADGTLESVVERTKIEKTETGCRCLDEHGAWQALTGDEMSSMNMWGFKPSLFAHLRREFPLFLSRSGNDEKAEFFVPTVVGTLMAEKRIRTTVLETPSSWFGVTYPQEKQAVVQRLREKVGAGEYPAPLWK